MDGSSSCTKSCNSAINKRDKDKTVPVKAIMVWRGTGNAFSLNFKDGSVEPQPTAASPAGGRSPFT